MMRERNELSEQEGRGAFRARRHVVLASASPRRRELLAGLGLTFTVLPSPEAEPAPEAGEDPVAYVMRTAAAKALAVARRLNQEIQTEPLPVVIGADTIVVVPEADGPHILGKPADDTEALAMLLRLAGRAHTVSTGCCLVWPEGNGFRTETFSETTRVTFAPWPKDVLAAYVRTGEGRDKAGSYAMQGRGAFLISRIEGCWSTVVGLPTRALAARLVEAGVMEPAKKFV